MKKQLLIWSLATLLTAILVTGGLFIFYPPNPFPKDMRSHAAAPLYYPTQLPPRFTINQDSFSQTNNVIIYSFDTPDGNKLHFSIEKVPAGYDFDRLYGITLQDTKTVATPLGTA